MKTKLTIVIPAYNEEYVILATLKDFQKKLKIPYKIIVANDHSTDLTSEIVKKYSRTNQRVQLVNNFGPNRGFASTLKIGFNKANSDYVMPVMADLCDDPRTINRIYPKLNEGWDIICGSRYMKGGRKKDGPKIQGFLSAFVCRSLHLLTGVPTTDVSNAFKAYKKSILKNVRIREGAGVEISMEITMQAYFKGAKIMEVPTTWKGRTAGQSKFKIVQRAPRYWKIYIWSIDNSFRKLFNLALKTFYV